MIRPQSIWRHWVQIPVLLAKRLTFLYLLNKSWDLFMESHCLLVNKTLLRPKKSDNLGVARSEWVGCWMSWPSAPWCVGSLGKVALWCLDTPWDRISAGIKGCDLCRSGFSNHGGIKCYKSTAKNHEKTWETAGKWCLIGCQSGDPWDEVSRGGLHHQVAGVAKGLFLLGMGCKRVKYSDQNYQWLSDGKNHI